MLGGAIWKITKETEDVIYAVDYNHMRDRYAAISYARLLSFFVMSPSLVSQTMMNGTFESACPNESISQTIQCNAIQDSTVQYKHTHTEREREKRETSSHTCSA
jgi:hypothetical protein